MTTSLRAVLLAVAIAAVAAPSAHAADLLTTKVAAGKAAPRTCHARPAAGARGVVQRTVRSDVSGLVRARLAAASGDWDVAIFDRRSGRSVAGAASFGPREVAEGVVRQGQSLIVQACRRSGSSSRAALEVDTVALPAPDGKPIKLVRIEVPNVAARMALDTLDLDLTEHARQGFREALLYDEADEALLRKAGLDFKVEVADVVPADRVTLKVTAPKRRGKKARAAAVGTEVPSGRTTYRHLEDYQAEMKQLVADNPGLVKPLTLPHPSLEGRAIEGIEITKDVAASDGKPVFLQMGVHHAREWPSGEHAIEFAYDLVNGVKANDERTVKLLEQARVIVVPIVNPDGFNLSREAPIDSGQPVVDPDFAYKRRNCRVLDGALPAAGECGLPENRDKGVDPNRNYGGLWGGPGASNSPLSDTYRGASPFSEPETQNIRELVSQRQVVTLITNHTYSDLVLRPPGVQAQGPPPDEPVYKELGDAMAAENGYVSQKGYELYDTTGTTEDWSYFATGGLGFTFEIGPASSQSTLIGSGFHPAYPVGVIAEYNGKYPQGGGNREAYFLALESTVDTARHSVLKGRAPAGSIIRLHKAFDTATSPVVNSDGPPTPAQSFRDTLETTMTVPGSGEFAYHVNPSTRPAAMGKPGRPPGGPTTANMALAADGETQSFPSQDASLAPPGTYKDFPFEIKEGEDNETASIRIEWESTDDDFDLFVFKEEGPVDTQLGSSAQGGTDYEQTSLAGGDAPIPPGQYYVRVTDYETTSHKFTGEITFSPPTPAVPATTETWTVTCEKPNGTLLGRRDVLVSRGETQDLGDACSGGDGTAGAAAGGDAGAPGAGAGGGLKLAVAADRTRLATALRRGLRVRARCSAACELAGQLVADGRTAKRYKLARGGRAAIVARGAAKAASGRATFRLAFTRAARRSLARARSVRLTLRVTARAGADRGTASSALTLR